MILYIESVETAMGKRDRAGNELPVAVADADQVRNNFSVFHTIFFIMKLT